MKPEQAQGLWLVSGESCGLPERTVAAIIV